MNGGIIRQHADDDVAFEQILDFQGRVQAERSKLFGTIGMPSIGGNPAAAGGQVGCHDAAHAAEPDKPDPTLEGLATVSGRSVVRRHGRHYSRIDVLMLHT
jgi:hypothetical protein